MAAAIPVKMKKPKKVAPLGMQTVFHLGRSAPSTPVTTSSSSSSSPPSSATTVLDVLRGTSPSLSPFSSPVKGGAPFVFPESDPYRLEAIKHSLQPDAVLARVSMLSELYPPDQIQSTVFHAQLVHSNEWPDIRNATAWANDFRALWSQSGAGWRWAELWYVREPTVARYVEPISLTCKLIEGYCRVMPRCSAHQQIDEVAKQLVHTAFHCGKPGKPSVSKVLVSLNLAAVALAAIRHAQLLQERPQYEGPVPKHPWTFPQPLPPLFDTQFQSYGIPVDVFADAFAHFPHEHSLVRFIL